MLRPLSAELAEKACLELNEDPSRVSDAIQHMKDWLVKQPHLRARTDDQWLLAFLRGCKFSLERTKEKIDLYYAVRNTAPEFYRIKHTDPRFNEILELGSLIVLPKLASPVAPRVFMIRPGSYDADKYAIADVISLYVHNKNYDEMYKYICKDILPAEYGGEGGTIKEITDYWKKKVEEYSDFLEADYQYGTDETKRLGKPKTAEDMFGLEGSFRQLQFD
ncbi:Clavesin-2 [Papilio machaon]|uniref:Clavesin-2 n=1 Tax=Papilio machaon TaxID=76193 RepID=A0A194R2K1_PAPMA|nr:Clavesin-2 [Papilio machaon]